jgi:hypothetical protein
MIMPFLAAFVNRWTGRHLMLYDMGQPEANMYTQGDLEEINSQLRRRIGLWALPQLPLLAALVYTLIIRYQVMTIVIFVLMGWIAVFAAGVSIAPVAAYRKFLRGLLGGRKRDLIGVFKGFDTDTVMRDKVRYVPLMLNVGDIGEPKDDRLLYWDANLPLPAWQPGDKLWISSHDKSVADWRKE